MTSAAGLGLVIAVALVALVGCSGDPVPRPDRPVPSTASATPSAVATGSSAEASPTASPTAGAASSATPSVTPSAAAPQTASPSAAAPAPVQTTAQPPAQPDQPQQIPDPQVDRSADFQSCSQDYLDLTGTISLSPTVTPVVVEGWEQEYQRASALAAEGSYQAAAAACQELVATITRATR
jgi:hypothetical protein